MKVTLLVECEERGFKRSLEISSVELNHRKVWDILSKEVEKVASDQFDYPPGVVTRYRKDCGCMEKECDH